MPLSLHHDKPAEGAKTTKDHTMALTFVLSDESVNSYGTRVLTDGIELSLFENNPIMLWMHNRVWAGRKDEVLPIGRWENIRKEGGKLLADAVFDEQDEFAQKIKSKVEQKILNMASIGINVIVTSEDKSVVVQGQTRPTILKSLLTEASICDIGSNRNALRMCDEFGSELNLSDGNPDNHLLPLLHPGQPEQCNQNNHDMTLMERITAALQMKGTVSDEQIVAHIADMQAKAKEADTLRVRVDAYETAEKERKDAACAGLVDGAIEGRKITADMRETYLGFARANYEGTKAILDKMPAAADLSETGVIKAPAADAWALRKAEIDRNKQNR